jgi:hypothetical protein
METINIGITTFLIFLSLFMTKGKYSVMVHTIKLVSIAQRCYIWTVGEVSSFFPLVLPGWVVGATFLLSTSFSPTSGSIKTRCREKNTTNIQRETEVRGKILGYVCLVSGISWLWSQCISCLD